MESPLSFKEEIGSEQEPRKEKEEQIEGRTQRSEMHRDSKSWNATSAIVKLGRFRFASVCDVRSGGCTFLTPSFNLKSEQKSMFYRTSIRGLPKANAWKQWDFCESLVYYSPASSKFNVAFSRNSPMSEPTIESLSNRILAAAIDLWNRRASSTGSFCSATSDQELADWEAEKLEEFRGELKRFLPVWPAQEPNEPTGLLEGLTTIYSQVSELRMGLGIGLGMGLETAFRSKSESDARVAKDIAVLRDSLHRAISLLSTCGSVSQAIEDSARRQVYELAYGLTHEINNPLGNIAARAQLLLSKAIDPMDRKALATILDQSMRAHELLAEMMRVVQPRLVERIATDLMALAKSQFDQLAGLAEEKKIRWEWVEPQGLQATPQAQSNASRTLSKPITAKQIENRYHSVVCGQGVQEAIRLVAQNAIEATRRRDSIRWGVEREGDLVSITISDTGPGVSPQAARRAFDLYYSGREAGRGLGVSLAAVRRFVEENAGQIYWSSEEGIGTSVRMEFPAV